MTSRAQVEGLYRNRLEQKQAEAGLRRNIVARVAYARLAIFVAGIAVAWFAFETDSVAWPWLLVPVNVFFMLLYWHGGLYGALRRTERAASFYLRGLDRLSDAWMGKGHQGASYLDPKHPHAGDLDIFGKASLFELLATTGSPWGTKKLASWLLAPASPDTVRAHQAAVAELTPLVDLRESIASEHDELGESVDPETLSSWATEPPVLTSKVARGLAFVIGAASFIAGIGWLASWWTRLPFLLLILVSASFAFFYRSRALSVLAAVEDPASALRVLSSLLERLEGESFSAPRLVSLQKALTSSGSSTASKRIRQLGRLVDYLDARRNQLFLPFAAILLWGTQFAFAIESWRRESGGEVARWLDAVGELDALLALATYAFEHPDDRFPTIVEDRVLFDAEGIGHPLIPEARVVRNDVRFGGELRLLVISGSNMSGKSTFLRAVGVNTVLALAGAPVRARKLTLSPLIVAASIRIVDSLQDGISHFYAEILRLRQVMELSGAKEGTVLFLLDEILHGTNSHDRRIGADAVVRGLVDRGAVGFITTHDLALSKLADALGDRAINVHFEDEIVDGKVHFDYIMRDGVVKKSNALDLMRSIGLEV